MDLFEKAFGSEFEPHLDRDAAIKFILNSLLMDRDIDRLIELLDVSLEVGGIEGEPGWELERIEDKDRNLSGYSEWPVWAYYRAAVDSNFYELSHPEAYYKAEDFVNFAKRAVNAYLDVYPEEGEGLESLVRLLNSAVETMK